MLYVQQRGLLVVKGKLSEQSANSDQLSGVSDEPSGCAEDLTHGRDPDSFAGQAARATGQVRPLRLPPPAGNSKHQTPEKWPGKAAWSRSARRVQSSGDRKTRRTPHRDSDPSACPVGASGQASRAWADPEWALPRPNRNATESGPNARTTSSKKNLCHACGQPANTSMDKPLCRRCYRAAT